MRLFLALLLMAALGLNFVGLAFEKVKFAVISDPHISLPALGVTDGFKLGTKTVEFLRTVVDELNKISDLDFVLVCGDLTLDGEPWNIDAVKALLDELVTPYYVVLGNHDISLVPTEKKPDVITGVSRWTIVSAFQGGRGGFAMDGRSYYVRELAPDLVLVALDTTHVSQFYGWGGEVSAPQLRWLKEVLAANADKFVIVLAHHNFVAWHSDEVDDPLGKKWYQFLADNAAEVREIFAANDVELVLTGHRHISTRYKEVDGVYYFVNPSTCTYPMRYTVYELTPTSLSWRVFDVPAPQEVWDLAKANFLANEWWRPSDAPKTPEGDRKYLEFYEAPAFLEGTVTFGD